MDDKPLFRRNGNVIPRVAAVHDLCGYGKCSLGIAIPVLSAAGIDVCAVPTSLFSAHTKFPVFHMHDTTPMLDAYLDAWAAEGVELDGVYSGFLGSASQVAAIRRIYREHARALRIVDPVMGDGGRKYPTYTDELCEATRALVDGADVLTPNLTEASILAGVPYRGKDVDDAYVADACRRLLDMGAKAVVLKGIVRSAHDGRAAEKDRELAAASGDTEPNDGLIRNYVATSDDPTPVEVASPLLPYMLHGTGDLFASGLVAAIYAERPLTQAVEFAGRLVTDAMRITPDQPDYRLRGVSFETVLSDVTDLLR